MQQKRARSFVYSSCSRRPSPPVLVLALALAAGAVRARPASAQSAGPASTPDTAAADAREAAFLFAYRAKPGQRAAFDAGYRRHLAWHEGKADPFVWYGWDVVAGAEEGAFVDGTFGPTPAEFARRIDPEGDAADYVVNLAPFAEPLWRRAYRHRPDLGTSRRLEDRTPSKYLRVFQYDVRPGASAEFEALLRRLATARAGAEALDRAVYALLEGGPAPEYLVLVSLDADPGAEAGSAIAWLVSLAGPPARAEAAAVLSRTVVGTTSALWRLRPDLTRIPSARPRATISLADIATPVIFGGMRDETKEIQELLPLPLATFHILLSLQVEERHGYAIMQDVAARTGGDLLLGPGTLYRSIHRMTKQGLIEESRHRRGADGAGRRRNYRITELGTRVARAEAARLAELVSLARAAGLAAGPA